MRAERLFLGLVGFTALAVVGCSDDGDKGTDAGPSELDFAAFDQKVEAFLTEKALAGASAVVVHKERGIAHERGYGAFAADRVYLIASASKILSVGVLMRLDDQGLLDIDAPLPDALPEWEEHKADISIASLVSNSSGMVSLTENATYLPYICQYVAAGTLSDCASAIYGADDAAMRITPDTMFKYGGGQWQLAGGIAEVASNKSWAALIDETYVQPCGTSSLGYGNHFQRASESAGGSLGYPDFSKATRGTSARLTIPTSRVAVTSTRPTTARFCSCT